MKIIKQIAILFSVCWIAQIIEKLLPFAFPASVIGMILLFLLLCVRVIRIEHIKESSNFLLSNMAFFFIPAGVNIINYWDVLKESLAPFLFICIVTTVITFAATAYSMKAVLYLMRRRAERKKVSYENTMQKGGVK